MTATVGDPSAESGGGGSPAVPAGRVGRPHGLDGSFYVTGARSRLLALGTAVTVAGRTATVTRRAGTDDRPIVRLQGIEDRGAAEAVRGLELTVDRDDAPILGDGEWWGSELEGCEVVDGERHVGIVIRLVELPSCEALEVRLAASGSRGTARPLDDPLVPMVREAIRHVDTVRRRIDVDMSFLEETL
ncbi:MAG TPA: ribosome maturation factor RimM [Solirubrobacteraceae bacterium]|nr:ribosome maturation factor RimM [Solirubrobacteraceae bacterium]